MSVICDVTTCNHNDSGSCDLVDIYISDAETGDPICYYAEFEDIDEIKDGE